MNKVFLLFITSVIAASSLAAQEIESADPLLSDAEKYRGVLTGSQGMQWRVDVQSTSGRTPKAAFYAVSQGNQIFADVVEPDSAKGRKYIATSDGQMWFWKPGLSKPVAVYRNQRLKGDAAIGDIASTSYVKGYNVTERVETELDGEEVVLFTLVTAPSATRLVNNSSGFHKIRYWVTKEKHLGVKAEFYSRTGSLMRTSTMAYENELEGEPFISKMVVEDSGRTVTLSYSQHKLGQYDPSIFDVSKLGGGGTRTIKKFGTFRNR